MRRHRTPVPTDGRGRVSNLITQQRDFYAGIDVGQVNDWTAIGIIERLITVPRAGLHFGLQEQAEEEASKVPIALQLRHLERIPLATMYPDQIELVRGRLRDPRISGVRSFLDMTGCGRPVFDMFKRAGLPDLSGVMITGAHGEATRQPYGWNVGKTELVTRLQVEFQTGRLRIGRGIPEAVTLVRELKEFQAVINRSGNTIFNAREGQHDDLVLALALAVFGALRPRPLHSMNMRYAA